LQNENLGGIALFEREVKLAKSLRVSTTYAPVFGIRLLRMNAQGICDKDPVPPTLQYNDASQIFAAENLDYPRGLIVIVRSRVPIPLLRH
jgi:hypothetical protein